MKILTFKLITASSPRLSAPQSKGRRPAAAAAACLALLTATAPAEHLLDDGYISEPLPPLSGDFDGDGAVDSIRIDSSGSQFQVGYRVTHPDFAWWPTAKPSPFGGFRGGITVAVGDVNNDGTDDLLIASFAHQAIAVFLGSRTRANALASYELQRVGAGPAGMAFGQFETSTPALELAVPLLAELQPRTVGVRPQSGWSVATAPLDPLMGSPINNCEGFAYLSGSVTGGGGRHTGHLGAYLFKEGTGSRLRVARFASSAAPLVETHATAWTQLLAANMRGPNAPGQFVLWAPGVDSLSIGTASTPSGGNAVAMEKIVLQMEGLESVAEIGGPGRDRLAVLHHEGARVSIIGWNGALFAVEQVLDAPAGHTFKRVGGLKWRTFPGGGLNLDGGLLLELSDGTFATHVFNAGGMLVPAAQGALPALPATGGHATVMLYTDDPLSGDAFEFQSFVAGDWGTDALFAGGEISALSEIFQSTALGLGSAQGVVLEPFANPGASAQAQGNQFGDASSSIFFAGVVGADGNAAVQISPQSGSYGAAIQVKFTPAVAGTSVVYRVNGQAWQQAGAGGFFLAADAVVEYYGQSAGGALSTIHSANYDITPQFAADANGDGLPDALAASLGLDPGGDGDTDDDGVGDANELLNGGDPRNVNSQPAALNVTLPPSLEISLSVLTPSENGPGDTASRWMRVSMLTTSGSVLREDLVMVNGGGSFRVDAALLPAERAGEPGLSDFERALIAEVELQGTDPEARGASLFGMAFAPGFVLPQQPADDAPSLTRWIVDTTAAVGGASGGIWKTTNFLTTDSGPMLINADTTLAVAAFSAWSAHRLNEAGVADANFAWDHRGSRGELPAQELAHVQQQLRSMERPANPATPAYDLGAVARSFYTAIATGTTYEPLRIAAREMIRRDGDPDRPIILGRVHNAAQALLHFFDTGELEPFYAASITQPMAVLNTLRAQLLGLPQPRSTRTSVGILRSMDGGQTWTLNSTGGEIIALLDERRIGVMTATGLTLQHRPATARTFPMWQAALARNDTLKDVRVFGFTLPATEPRPPGTHSAIALISLTVLDVDLRGNLHDTDGDRLDDAFEMRFFNGLDASFDDDTDDDGFFNGEEYFLLTDPASAASRPPGATTAPRNIAVSPAPGGGLCVCWDGRPDTSYQVAESPDLAAWSGSAALPVQTAPGRYQWTNPGTAARLFVQIVTQFE